MFVSGDLSVISSGIDGPGRRFAKPHFGFGRIMPVPQAPLKGPAIMIPRPKPAAAGKRPTAPGPYIARGGSGRLGRPQGRTSPAALAHRMDSVHGPGSPVDAAA